MRTLGAALGKYNGTRIMTVENIIQISPGEHVVDTFVHEVMFKETVIRV